MRVPQQPLSGQPHVPGTVAVTGPHAPRPEVDVAVDHLGQGWHCPGVGDEPVECAASSGTPASYFCTEPHLGDDHEGKQPPFGAERWSLSSLAFRRALGKPGARDHRVDHDGLSHGQASSRMR